MKKIVKFFLVLFCVFNLVGCFKQEKVDYDSVQMTLLLSSTKAGQPHNMNDSKVIYQLWELCQESHNELGNGEQWEIKFMDSQTNTEKKYIIYESQKDVYDEVTKTYNDYFDLNN